MSACIWKWRLSNLYMNGEVYSVRTSCGRVFHFERFTENYKKIEHCPNCGGKVKLERGK